MVGAFAHAACGRRSRSVVRQVRALHQGGQAPRQLHLAVITLDGLRLERIRTTDADQVPSALVDARRSLSLQRERDAGLVRAAVERIEAAKRIDPLEIHRILSISQMEKTSARALTALETFANASRLALPDADWTVRRPALSETRAEVKRQAINATEGVVDVSKALGEAASSSARHASEAVRERVRRKRG